MNDTSRRVPSAGSTSGVAHSVKEPSYQPNGTQRCRQSRSEKTSPYEAKQKGGDSLKGVSMGSLSAVEPVSLGVLLSSSLIGHVLGVLDASGLSGLGDGKDLVNVQPKSSGTNETDIGEARGQDGAERINVVVEKARHGSASTFVECAKSLMFSQWCVSECSDKCKELRL